MNLGSSLIQPWRAMWESEQEIENHKTGVNKSVCSVKYTFIPESYLQKISQFITQKDIVVKKTKQKINKVKYKTQVLFCTWKTEQSYKGNRERYERNHKNIYSGAHLRRKFQLNTFSVDTIINLSPD